MPCTVKVKTLKQACLRNVARNMDRVWSKDFDRHIGDMPRLLYVLGPFDYLTPDMIQDLLNNLAADRRLRRTHLQLLLTSHLDHLDFSKCASMTSMLPLVGIRCQKLVKLNLSNCSTATPSVLCSIFQSLPLLRWLNLRQTKANDQVLTTILSSCIRLQHLDMFACPITDRGIVSMWELLQNDQKTNNINGKVQEMKKIPGRISLLYFDISATKIGSKGAVLILQMFHDLHVLQYADVIDAVAQIYSSCVSQKDFLKLRTLTATGIKCKDISPESVHMACLHCPHITEVYFYQNARDSSIQCLKQLKHLHTLEITSDQWGDVTFFDGLKPLFQEIGKNIQSLGLYDIKDLDIGQLGVLCPKLTRLKCVMAVFNSVAFVETPLLGKDLKSIYKCLKNLMIVIGNDSTNFSPSMFEQILENSVSLTELHLINVQCLTTQMLLHAVEKHGLRSLTSLTLESCDKITEDAISQLLECDSSLQNICLRNCHEITRQDLDSFKQYVQANNLNVSIIWE